LKALEKDIAAWNLQTESFYLSFYDYDHVWSSKERPIRKGRMGEVVFGYKVIPCSVCDNWFSNSGLYVD